MRDGAGGEAARPGGTPQADESELVRVAAEVRSRAYAPYSGFSVGAAVLTDLGIFFGANVENASYGLSICAERVAAATAVAAGVRRIEAVAVAGSADRPTPPCGACRQFLAEFGPSMKVLSLAPDGGRKEWRLSDLMPEPFVPELLR
jgi:cytidine deaminase